MSDGERTRPRSKATSAGDADAVPKPARPSRRTATASADPADRPVPLRLARLHLRMGSLALARAELESLAGRALLDDDALLDLAEARWRTGDLAGAGEAADVVLARGREDPLALAIAAESIAAHGRPGEASKLAGRARDAFGGSLDSLFAGIPRIAAWPGDADGAPGVADERSGDPEPMTVPVGPDDAAQPASTGAAEAYAGGRAALGAGDTAQAAVRLGVALRLEPGFARDVLEAIGDRAGDPALALVVGDALRLLGRESEALAAYDHARGHEHGPAAGDDDPGRTGDAGPG